MRFECASALATLFLVACAPDKPGGMERAAESASPSPIEAPALSTEATPTPEADPVAALKARLDAIPPADWNRLSDGELGLIVMNLTMADMKAIAALPPVERTKRTQEIQAQGETIRAAVRKLAAAGDVHAQFLMEGEDGAAVKRAADAGFAPAQERLARYYGEGSQGFEKNDAESKRLRQAAAAQGNGEALARLAGEAMGEIYSDVLPAPGAKSAEALPILKKADEAGNLEAHTQLAWLLMAGAAGVEKNDAEARKLLEAAIGREEWPESLAKARAMTLLGIMREQGRAGFAPSREEALELYQMAWAYHDIGGDHDGVAREQIIRLGERPVDR
jgi:hypothetical protein